MSLLIVGATGTLGRQIARQAIDEGYSVRCLVRSFNRASFLRKWGAELVRGDLCDPTTLPPALDGITHVIDAATVRVTDSLSVKEVDWHGKVALIQAAHQAGVERFVFCSILNNDQYPHVPLMEIKRCTERFLAESGLNYTVLQLAGFMQGLIGQYAIPILDNQPVWLTGKAAPIAYANTQDIAKFAVKALSLPETANQTYPVVGTRAWSAEEIIQLCERLSGRTARITRAPLGLLRTVRRAARFFQWGANVADRLYFAEVLASGTPLATSMDDVYPVFDINPNEMTTLEAYLQEYHSSIMKKIKEIEYEQEKTKARKKRQRSPFKSSD
ncbi:3-beta hydroxysteroid dehydrogenase [Phormidium willei BDU 130791]|nr:3-beta hydroxysteroid dehydrogenase [Phormidium willei BDU 130791]